MTLLIEEIEALVQFHQGQFEVLDASESWDAMKQKMDQLYEQDRSTGEEDRWDDEKSWQLVRFIPDEDWT